MPTIEIIAARWGIDEDHVAEIVEKVRAAGTGDFEVAPIDEAWTKSQYRLLYDEYLEASRDPEGFQAKYSNR